MTTSLIVRGSAPRYAIGSQAVAEFFVSSSAAGTFIASLGLESGWVVLGLLVGGVPAAPLVAFLAKRLSRRVLMFGVAVAVTALAIYTAVVAVLT